MFGSACAESVSAGGLGNLTLGGALVGHRTLNSVFSNDTTNAGIYCQYAIEDTGDALETGVGHLSAATTFVRDWMEYSSTGSALNVSTAAKVRATPIGQGLLPAMPTVPAGVTNRVLMPAYPAAIAGAAPATGSVWYIPILVDAMATFDAIVFEVTTAAAAGALANCGIYSVGTDGMPKRLVAQGAEVAVDTIGVKASTFTARRLPPSLYALAYQCSVAPTIRTISSVLSSPWGCGSALNSGIRRASQTLAYAATLPAAAAAGTPNDTGNGPLLGLRISA